MSRSIARPKNDESRLPPSAIHIGCAGWSLRKEHSELFPSEGSHLARYSGIFNCVEINSSFKTTHQRQTYERWARSVPENFRFSVKIPKSISHIKRLLDCEEELEIFLHSVEGLGSKCGPLLLQLPPSASFIAPVADSFFTHIHKRTDRRIVIEPRHPSWIEAKALSLFLSYGVKMASADPSPFHRTTVPASYCYTRLHGSPRIYYSAYSTDYLVELNQRLATESPYEERWVIFDNTALGFATLNALELLAFQTNHSTKANEENQSSIPS